MSIFSRLAATAVFAVALPFFASPANACGPDTACEVEGGHYHAALPPGWDGRSPLPAAVFFHGWRGSAEGVMKWPEMRAAFAENGILLIVPEGLGGGWAHQGSPRADQEDRRDELAFIGRVVADVKRRWPINDDRLWATGFSIGGSMVWDLACNADVRFAAYAPLAGAFWTPLPVSCTRGPVHLRHEHGTTDGVVPLAGRPIRDRWRQGDVFRSFAVVRAANGCAAEASRIESDGFRSCQVWDRCAGGRELRLCLHDGAHDVPADFISSAWAWVQSVTGEGRRPVPASTTKADAARVLQSR